MPSANTGAAAINSTGGTTLIAAQGAGRTTVLKSLILSNATASAVFYICGWGAAPFLSIQIPAYTTYQFIFQRENSPANTALIYIGASGASAYAEYDII